jgi:predicted sulfurtransferase
VQTADPLPVLTPEETVSCTDFKATILDKRRPHVLLDVREPHQYAIALLPGAISIPLKHLKERLPEVKVGARLCTAVAIFCGVGGLRFCPVPVPLVGDSGKHPAAWKGLRTMALICLPGQHH